MIIKKVYLFVSCFLLSLSGWSQIHSVSGKVVDTVNEPVAFANILVLHAQDSIALTGTSSDENGKFIINNIETGTYILKTSFIGFKDDFTPINISSNTDNIAVVLEESIEQLSAVQLVFQKPTLKREADRLVFKVENTALSQGNLVEVLRSTPSILVLDDTILVKNESPTVYINDRRVHLSSSELIELLQGTSAANIKSVEVITNPSSKYSAQGTAGIINVVLKKGQKKRFNSSLEVFTGYRLTGGVNYNLAQSGETGSSWYANAGIGYSEPKAINDIFLRSPNNVPDISTQESDRIRNQYYYLINLGGTKKFNENNSLSGSLTYRGAQSDNSNTTFYEDFNEGSLFNSSNRNENEDETNNFINGNISFDHKFKKEGHQLSFSASGEYTEGDEDAVISTMEIVPLSETLNQDVTKNEEKISRYVLSTDYTLPMKNNYTLELGYRSDLTSTENDFSVERQSDNMTFVIPEFTDKTDYDEKVHAFYGQLSKKYEKLSVNLGLRTEISDIDISSQANNFSNSKNYTDWFPSIFLNYAFNEKNKIQFSVSRRINRPRSWIIVPFSTFTDERNIFIGNSDINPSYVVATELSYTTKISSKFSFYPTLFYRNTTDEMEFFVEKQQITIGSETQDIFASTIANIGDYTTSGTELGVSYKPFNWWNMYGEIVLNGFKQRGSFRGASFDGDGLLVSGRYNTTFNFFKSMKFQIQNYYRGPIETGQYRRKGFYGMNIGISNDLFKGNGSIAFNIRDVFNSNKRLVTTFGPDFTRDLELQYRVRQINLSLTYRFNQKQHKGKKGNQYDNFEIIN